MSRTRWRRQPRIVPVGLNREPLWGGPGGPIADPNGDGSLASHLLRGKTNKRLKFRHPLRSWRQGEPASPRPNQAPRLNRLPHKQRYEKRKRQQSRHALPDLERGAFVERAWAPDFGWRTRRSRLHLKREFGHIVISLSRIDCDCARECRLDPRGKIRPQRTKVLRPVAPRWAGSVEVAIRELARESTKHRNA